MAIEVEGIVLKSFNYGEHHRIVKVLTRKLGIIGVFVQNANKVNTKKSALVQPLTCAHFNLKESTTSTLYYMQHGEVLDNYIHIKTDYEVVLYFYLMIEIIMKGVGEHEYISGIYEMLKHFLDLAEKGYNARILSIVFQLKMLSVLGIAPIMDGCAVCHTTSQIVTVSVRQGGLVCAKCYQSVEPLLISAELIPLLRALYKVDVLELPEIELPEADLEVIEKFLDLYYDTYAGFTLQTKKVMSTL